MKHHWTKSFLWAFEGWKHLIITERHAQFHLIASIVVIAAGIYFPISKLEWIILVFCIGAVWSSEAFNTAFERLSDRITQEQDPAIKHTKDLAAAGVLIVSLTTAIIGVVIFWKYIFH